MSTIQVLQIKLGCCLSGPTRRFYQDLDRIAKDANRARISICENWKAWKREHSDWEPEQRRDRKGDPKFDDKGNPVMESEMISQDAWNELYHAARGIVPHLSSSIVADCWNQVGKRLRQSTAWDHRGEADYVWQAILANETASPSYRGICIPAMRSESVLGYDGMLSKSGLSKTELFSRSGCVFQFPMFSLVSGRAVRHGIVRLLIGKKSRGHRRIIRDIAARKLPLRDSLLVKKGKNWFLNLTYKHPGFPVALNKDRVAALMMNDPSQASPFLLRLPEGSRPYYLGCGKVFEAEHLRIQMRRRVIRARYRDGSKRGRGKKKFFAGLRPYERSFRDLQDRIQKLVIADIVRLMIQHDCASITYREPTMPVREFSWFAARGIPFNWSVFNARLKFKLAHHGIKFPKRWDRMRMAEYRELYPRDEKKDAQ